MSEIYPSTSLDTLFLDGQLSSRTYKTLVRAKMSNVGDIIKYIQSGRELISIFNLGKRSLQEIDYLLSTCNATEKEENEVFDGLSFEGLETPLKERLSNAFESIVTQGPIRQNHGGILNFFSEKYPTAGLYFKTVICNGDEEILEFQPSLSIEDNIAYRNFHIEILKEFLSAIEAYGFREPQAKHLYNAFSELLNNVKNKYLCFTVYDTIKYFSGSKNSFRIEILLQECYEQLCRKLLSVRAENFRQKYIPSYKDVVRYLDKPLTDFFNISPQPSMRKTLMEIYNLVQKFKTEEISSLNQNSNNENALLCRLQREYPFLNVDQCNFVQKYIRKNKRRPTFYLLYNFLRTTSKRECLYYSLYHGLRQEGPLTAEEIGSQYQLSGERVRQLIVDHDLILDKFPIKEEERDYYRNLITSNVITKDSPEFKTILTDEHLPEDFAVFTALCSLILDFDICEIQGYRVLMSPALKRSVKFSSLIKKFNKTYYQNQEDTTYPHSYFTGEIPSEYSKDIFILLTLLAKDKNNISVTEKEVKFGPRKLDIAHELYLILEKEGRPLHLDELFARFKSIHPEHKFTKSSQISVFVYSHEHIRPIGKQYMYGLDSWDHVYYGSIRDLLYETLEKSDVPLHISHLFEQVKKHFTSTTINSLISTMPSDPKNRFILFKEGYYGIFGRPYPEAFKRSRAISNLNFEQRIQMVKSFVETNQRFPFFNGDEQEAALARWLYSSTHGYINYSQEELSQLNTILSNYPAYEFPRSSREQKFKLMCSAYKTYVEENGKLPTLTDSSDSKGLQQWFYRAKEIYKDCTDQRHDYFIDLCNFLRTHGFEINL